MGAFNPSTQEAEAGMDLCDFQGQPGLQSEFQDTQGYTVKPCLKTKQNIYYVIFVHLHIVCVCVYSFKHICMAHVWSEYGFQKSVLRKKKHLQQTVLA